MKLQSMLAGPVTTAEVRRELTAAEALPIEPHFLIRATQPAPLVLSSLALDFTLLITQPVSSTTGWIAVPINHPLAVGQRLAWTVLVGGPVARLAAFLAINQKLKYLKHKDGLAAGASWAPNPVVLRPPHLS